MTDPVVVVVMGVSGSGKTTVATGIAERLGWTFGEGDELHPAANVAKMSRGEPLTDDDRWPWLAVVGAWMDAEVARGESAVVTCSALRRAYRDVLCDGRPEVVFCHVTATPERIEARVEQRSGHFMPASLVPSQLATLEPLAADEPGFTVSAEGSAEAAVAQAVDLLTARGDHSIRARDLP